MIIFKGTSKYWISKYSKTSKVPQHLINLITVIKLFSTSAHLPVNVVHQYLTQTVPTFNYTFSAVVVKLGYSYLCLHISIFILNNETNAN